MSQTFSASRLKSVAEELLDGKEFFISAVVDRLREAANVFPHDGAIRTAQLIIEKKAAKSGPLALMSQRDFQGVYDDVCGLGNKVAFRDLLGDLLIANAADKVAHYNDNFALSIRNGEEPIFLVDADAVEALAGLFDEPSKAVKGSFVDNGRKGIALELEEMGFPEAEVAVACKNNSFVIYAASFESNKGRMSTYIPAEIKLGSVLMPTMFVSSAGLEDLTKENLIKNIEEVATNGAGFHPQKILELLTSAVAKPSSFNVNAELANSTIALATPEYFNPIEENVMEAFAEQPKVKVPESLMHFTDAMARDVLAEAGLSYDPKVVLTAKTVVAEELRNIGIPCSKVSIASEFDGGITIVANISGPGGNKTIEVPIEIINSKVLMPSVFISGALAKTFDAENLKAFAMNRDEGTFSTSVSDKSAMGFKELHRLALNSAAYGRFVEAEEALAVIAEHYGDSFHKVAFDDLMGLLNIGFGKEEKPMDAMDRYIKDAATQLRDKESNIKMTSNLMYLHPED